MLRAVAIDDEDHAIEAIKILASRNSELIKVVASALKPKEGIGIIENYKPDIVFLDISMPNMNGFELLSQLSHRDFKLVFTTAHRDYAITAFKHKAFDYLLKPIDDEDFKRCIIEINKAIQNKEENRNKGFPATIELPVKDGIIYVKQQDIIRLEGSRNYTYFYLDNGVRHVASKTMGEFEPKLDPKLFYRCHKSHIINLQKVQKFINREGFFALMTDGSRPDISKNSKDEFLEKLKSI